MQPCACAARAMRARSNACPVRNCTPGHSTSAISSPCAARHASMAASGTVSSPARGASSSSVLLRVEAVPGDLRGDRVPVRGEGAGLDEDAAALTGRAVEARQHQVQVHGERVHRDDFIRLRAGEGGEPCGERSRDRASTGAAHARAPRRRAAPSHRAPASMSVARRERLQPEGMPAQVGQRRAVARRAAARSARAAARSGSAASRARASSRRRPPAHAGVLQRVQQRAARHRIPAERRHLQLEQVRAVGEGVGHEGELGDGGIAGASRPRAAWPPRAGRRRRGARSGGPRRARDRCEGRSMTRCRMPRSTSSCAASRDRYGGALAGVVAACASRGCWAACGRPARAPRRERGRPGRARARGG